ncbi:MAG: hypothetical protein ABI843_11920 [Dokdonella sp.]
MLKRLIFATALFAASASAQQNTDISGAEFSTGKADARLAALAKQAAAEGKRLVITAPADWHKALSAKLRAGGHADVVLRDGFYENVLVRVEDKAEEPKPATEKVTARPVAKAVAAAPAPAAVVREATPAPVKSAPVVASPAPVAAAPSVAAVPVALPPASAPASKPTAATPVVDVDAIHTRLEQSLNSGRSARGTLAVASLQSGDTIYVDAPVRAVVRREGLKPELYWLDGDLDLRRTELKVLADSRYQVMSSIRGEGSLRSEFDTSRVLNVHVPADSAPVRAALERKINEGRTISDALAADKLRSGDIIYTSAAAAVVVRREGADLHRYWLDGTIDLRQSGVQADGANKFRIVSDTLR